MLINNLFISGLVNWALLKKRLLVIENYYKTLEPYFGIKKNKNINIMETTNPNHSKNAEFINEIDVYSKIRENQILYAKLLAKKVTKRKAKKNIC